MSKNKSPESRKVLSPESQEPEQVGGAMESDTPMLLGDDEQQEGVTTENTEGHGETLLAGSVQGGTPSQEKTIGDSEAAQAPLGSGATGNLGDPHPAPVEPSVAEVERAVLHGDIGAMSEGELVAALEFIGDPRAELNAENGKLQDLRRERDEINTLYRGLISDQESAVRKLEPVTQLRQQRVVQMVARLERVRKEAGKK